MRFCTPPLQTHWLPFVNSVAPYIRELSLDLKSLPASSEFMGELLASCPSSVALPRLQVLSIAIHLDEVEIELATRFLQPSVTRLAVEVWHPVRREDRAVTVMQRDACPEIPVFNRTPFEPPARGVLDYFFSYVSAAVPNLTRLDLDVHDGKQMADTWDGFSTMLVSSTLR